MDIHGNNTGNVWTPTSGNYRETITLTTPREPQVLQSKTYARIMATCMETHIIHIGGRQFLDWLCHTGTRISSNYCITNV